MHLAVLKPLTRWADRAVCVFSTYLSGVERYFCFWNFFSSPISCSSVKMVRLRRGFFKRGVGCSVSDSLLPCVSLAWVSEQVLPGGGCGDSTREALAVGMKWETAAGCLVMTEMSG